MSDFTAPTTSLQGAFYVALAGTLRVTYDPTGAATTSDFAIAAGTFYASAAALLAAIEAQVEADLGGAWTWEVVPYNGTDGTGRVKVTTPGLNYSVTWSWSGDTTQVRNQLGESGAGFGNRASGTLWTGPVLACFIPEKPAQALGRTSTSRPRGQGMSMAGVPWTQGSVSPSDADAIELDVELWFGPTTPHTQQGAFQTFLGELDSYASEGRFTLTHGSATWLVVLPDPEQRIDTERVEGAWDTLWRTRLALATVGAS